MEELAIKDWLGILGSQLDELILDEKGTLRAIELCEEALVEIEPVYLHLFAQTEKLKELTKAAQSLYKALYGRR